MREAKAAGFSIDLYYVALDNVERNIERVQFRVALGGHDIPEDAIRRRYKGSFDHLPQALALADEAVIVDNSEIKPRIVSSSGEATSSASALSKEIHSTDCYFRRLGSPKSCAAGKEDGGLWQIAFLLRNCLDANEFSLPFGWPMEFIRRRGGTL